MLRLFARLLVSIYVSQHKCSWKVNKCLYFFYLVCYLTVWHCYLGSILAFNIQIQSSYNLWTKPLNQLMLIYEQFWLIDLHHTLLLEMFASQNFCKFCKFLPNSQIWVQHFNFDGLQKLVATRIFAEIKGCFFKKN